MTQNQNAKRVSNRAKRKTLRPDAHREDTVRLTLGAPFILGCVAIGLGFIAWLMATARAIGYSRDEGFYFDAARRYASWYRLLFEYRESAMTRAMVDSHFSINHEHPPLMKALFGLFHEFLFSQNHWVTYEGLSFRLPTMLVAGLGIALVALWGARSLSRTAGIVAALSLAFMPRFFHHAHLACFDVPVACLCLASAFAWSRALETGKLSWSLGLGVVFGLTLATKHNAWLLPPAFLLHAVLVKGRECVHGSWSTRFKLALPFLSLLTIAPLVLYALWPWLWFDTWGRLAAWFQFHAKHDYYNMEYLGFTYWKPPMPRTYALVMTLGTVPVTTLLLFLCGCFFGARSMLASLARSSKFAVTTAPQSRVGSDFVLWAICIVTFYSPWLSTDTPIFGGTKHWMTAYPFLALVAGLGFHTLLQSLPMLTTRWRAINPPRALRGIMAALVLLPGAVMVQDMGPWGLSTYTPLVGGASGAATLGLNRTFWGYTTVALAPELRARTPGRVYLHDMTNSAWDMHQRDGTLPRNLYGTNSVTDWDLALYHHEPHMGRVEYQLWSLLGSASPASVGTCEGVPVVWLFDRRARPGSQPGHPQSNEFSPAN